METLSCANTKKGGKVTEEQKEIIVTFMENHPKLLKCKIDYSFTNKDATSLWKELMEMLNACAGPAKSVTEWRKCWQDLKRTAKDKAARIKNHYAKTGGGPACIEVLTSLQDRIVSLIGDVVVVGQPLSKESPICFDQLPLADSNVLSSTITPLSEHDSASNVLGQTQEGINMDIPIDSPIIVSVDQCTTPAETQLITETTLIQATSTKGKKRKRPSCMTNTAQATENFTNVQRDKLELKKQMHQFEKDKFLFQQEIERQKLKLQERQVLALESIAATYIYKNNK